MTRTNMDQVLQDGIEDDDLRTRATTLVRFMLNTQPGWRPSDAARSVVYAHNQGELIERLDAHDAHMASWYEANRNGVG